MSAFVPAGYLSNAGRTKGEIKTAAEDNLQATKQIPGAGAAETTLTISGGTITPTIGIHSVDTEGAAAADDLNNIAQTNLPDGSCLLLRNVASTRVVTVKHAAGGTGQVALAGVGDLALRTPTQWLALKRTGAQWEEVSRSGVVTPQLYARLEYDTTTQIALRVGVVPLWISGAWALRQITTPVVKSNAGLGANTFYFVYASASGASTVLGISTTGPALHDGIWVAIGDITSTLVGALYTTAATQFQNTGSFCGVVSWYDRKFKSVVGYDASTATSSASPVPVGVGVSFIRWSDSYSGVCVQASCSGTVAATVNFSLYQNAVAIQPVPLTIEGGATSRVPITIVMGLAGATGVYTIQAYATTSAGTITLAEINEVAHFMG